MDTRTTRRALTEALEKRPDIRLGYVFGSIAEDARPGGAARGRKGPRPDSDVDVAVAAGGPLDSARRLALMDDIALATGRPVDLVDLHTAGPLILTHVLTRRTCLVKRDRELLARLIAKMWYLNADFMPLVRRMQDSRRQRFLHGCQPLLQAPEPPP